MATPLYTANAMLHSVGVNVHLNYMDLNYGNVPLVVAQLAELGVRHVRDGLHTQGDDYDNVVYSAWVALSKIGVKFNAVVDPRSALGPITGAALNKFWWKSGMSIEALEGPNEFDISGLSSWIADLRAYHIALYNAAKTMAQGIAMSVYSPALAFAENAAQVGSLEQQMDFGSLHSYPAGKPPAVLYPSQPQLVAPMTGKRPLVMTESGYHNAIHETGQQPGVSEMAAAKYTLRLLIENLMHGIKRTYLYELQDEGNNPALTDAEHNWGLVRWDGTQKPVFAAVKNLLRLVNYEPCAVAPLSFSLSCLFPLQTLFLQRTSSSWLLSLCQTAPVWDLKRNADIVNTPIAADVLVPAGMNVSVYQPYLQAGPIQIFQNVKTVKVQVGDHPSVLVIEQP